MRDAVIDHLRALAADTSDLVSTLDDESLRGRIEPPVLIAGRLRPSATLSPSRVDDV